ncbi:leucine-rich repeat-containing protein 4B-like isoform X1 [Homarus americanus]|uniref:Insulin-like growth factor-binding protein complex acid labile subunit-like 2 n=2 Tax=Homarus americanus TaxID=6706 RepID=A0A8J5NC40_HOMAM|nr:leucine-rich repeat-containing protein 4B-like isoform X1 [Homarus americanus]KAG7177590.1 Insulin-like growth factor-binding protein complex acid labile subunit-like 2 [Homarus americanus]
MQVCGMMRTVVVMAAVTVLLGEAKTAAGVSCLPPNKIFPCTCKEKSRGPSIACETSDESQIMHSLSVLKENSFVIYRLMFRNLNFPRVHDYTFLGLDVQHLTMSRTNITVVEESSLRTLAQTLETLDLSYNNLHTVPTAALEHLQNLSFLNLNYNMIKILGQAAFSGLRALERLSLYDNQMQHIEENAFSGTGDKLFRLNLGKNHLENVPNLQALTKLQVLTLSDNRLSVIKIGSFKGLNMLDMLMLENNQIQTLEANVFSELSNLNSLNIKHNDIANISQQAFAGLEDNLEWLELGHNRLDHIPSHVLRPLNNLRQLDLDSNRIVDLPEDAFEGYGDSIKFLMLNRNNIKFILPMTFFELHSLEWLKLSHNDLQHLTEDTVQPVLDTLTMIDVSNNPLKCTCEIMWLRSWLKEFAWTETYKSFAQHTCITENSRTEDILELKPDVLGCPEYSADPKAVAISTPVVPGVTVFLTIVSLML